MIETIKKALNNQGVSCWRVTEEKLSSGELYFIKKNLDTRRMVDLTNYSVTVFHDFEKEGKKFRGSATVTLAKGMDAEGVEEKIKSAYFAAGFVANPFYELPKAVTDSVAKPQSKVASMTITEACNCMVEALYAADNRKDSWINSSEFFVKQIEKRIYTSYGTDVSFTEYEVKGEFVAQAKEPKDVELYKSFEYTDIETESLTDLVSTALDTVLARANAFENPKTGSYNVILSEANVKTLMDYYGDRSNVGFIYPGYSDWKVGTKVQGDQVKGEKVNLTLVAKAPYSVEAIPMKDLVLTENGELKSIYGGARVSYYLGVEPTGSYSAIKLDNGTMSMADMKKKPYLEVLAFSDFKMDTVSGFVGGEMRLARLYDGEKITYVTGGSMSANITELQKNFVFSTERYVDKSYEGPKAVLLENVSVAGM